MQKIETVATPQSVEVEIKNLVAEFDLADRGYLPRYFRLWELILQRRKALAITRPNKAVKAEEKGLCGGDKNRYYRAKLTFEFFKGDATTMQGDARGLLEVLAAAKAKKMEGKPPRKARKTKKTRATHNATKKAKTNKLQEAVSLLGGWKETLIIMAEVGLVNWQEIFDLAASHLGIDK